LETGWKAKPLLRLSKAKWVRVRQKKDGTKVRTEEEILPEMVYDDFLTASYNFVTVFGEIKKGQKYTVATFQKAAFQFE